MTSTPDSPHTTADDAGVMRLWRDSGLPEYFLGNAGTNHKLVAFAMRCFMSGRDAGLEAACGALAAVAIDTNRPECCGCGQQRGELSPPDCCGNPTLLVAAHQVGDAIRRLKEVNNA